MSEEDQKSSLPDNISRTNIDVNPNTEAAASDDMVGGIPRELGELLARQEFYSGPYPPPEFIKAFEEIREGLGASVMDEYLEEGRHRRSEATRRREQNYRATIVSYIVLVLIVAIVMTGVWHALDTGYGWVAALMGTATIIVIAVVSITRRTDGIAEILSTLPWNKKTDLPG